MTNELDTIIKTTQALALNPNDVDALTLRATTLFGMKSLEEAGKDIDTLIDTLGVKDNPQLYAMRGTIRMHYKDKLGAMDDLRTALALDPSLMQGIEGNFKI